ncbi:cytosine permease [Mycolicibacterium sp. A43C]
MTTPAAQQVPNDEYENSPVPLGARRSLMSNVLVWMGFPMILTCSVAGGGIVAALGFLPGVAAILVGNIVLFLYTGLIGVVSTRRGLNFRMQCALTFGTRGSAAIAGVVATLVVGWFAVQVALTGVSMGDAFDISILVMTVAAGVIYTAITMLGIRSLTLIGYLSVPLFLVFGIWAVANAVSGSGWSAVTAFSGNHAITFGFAVTMVIALFIDGGTMTGDFNRWAKNTKHSLLATAAAFPFANSVSMTIGGIITAALGSGEGANFFHGFAERGGLVMVLAVLLLFMNLGSVCAHNLYLSAIGWANLTGKSMRTTAAVIGALGIMIAASGAWSHFQQWLSILGILVPPIGAVMIVDQLVLRRWRAQPQIGYRLIPFATWGIGSAVSAVVEFLAPALSTAVVGIIVGGLAHYVLVRLFAPTSAQAHATDTPTTR